MKFFYTLQESQYEKSNRKKPKLPMENIVSIRRNSLTKKKAKKSGKKHPAFCVRKIILLHRNRSFNLLFPAEYLCYLTFLCKSLYLFPKKTVVFFSIALRGKLFIFRKARLRITSVYFSNISKDFFYRLISILRSVTAHFPYNSSHRLRRFFRSGKNKVLGILHNINMVAVRNRKF